MEIENKAMNKQPKVDSKSPVWLQSNPSFMICEKTPTPIKIDQPTQESTLGLTLKEKILHM